MINNNGILLSSYKEEHERLEELKRLNLLNTEPEEQFDRITALATQIFQVPICIISLVTEDEQWFKSCIGLPKILDDSRRIEREIAFCQIVVAEKKPIIIPDTLLDPRLKENRLVKDYKIRFYTGYPLTTESGNVLGTICLIDGVPRAFSDKDLYILKELSHWVMSEITLRSQLTEYKDIQKDLLLKNEQNKWLQTALEKTDTAVTILDIRSSNLPIVYCNQALSNLYKIPLSELLNTSYVKFRNRYNSSEELDELKIRLVQGQPFNVELCNNKNGELFWTRMHISPVFTESSKPLFTAIVENDITKERLVHQSIINKFNEQSTILNSIPDFFYVTTTEGKLVSWNRAFSSFIEAHSEFTREQSIQSFLPEHEMILYYNTVKEVFKKGSADVELTFQNNATTVPIQLSMTLYKDRNDKILGIACVGKDISERVQLRKDVDYAASIQKSFLPAPIHNDLLHIQNFYKPQNFISGDFFDYKWQGHTLTGYVVDLMGHGLATALQLSALQILMSQADEHNYSLAEKLKFFNQSLLPHFKDGFYATALLFSFNFETNTLTYASAGITHFFHNKEAVQVPGYFLGILPDVEFEEHRINFSSNDEFIFCTDGFYDHIFNQTNQKREKLLNSVESVIQETDIDDVTVIVCKIQ